MNGNSNYVKKLRKAVEQRTSEKCPLWLDPLIYSTAMQMQMQDQLQEEIMSTGLSRPGIGSTGQQTFKPNELLAHYNKVCANIAKNLEMLGITYSATPSKITESTKKGVDESDPMEQWKSAINL